MAGQRWVRGLHTKMLTVAARELGPALRPGAGDANPAPTRCPIPRPPPHLAARISNGQAVRAACVILRERLAPVAADLLGESAGPRRAPPSSQTETSLTPTDPSECCRFGEVVMKAYLARVSLAATGYYATPGIKYDHESGRGTPFYYYACGAAVSEVELDGFTGAHRTRARRHPPRRGPFDQSRRGPRADRGCLHARHGLAHVRGTALGPRGPTPDPRAEHVQNPRVRRHAGRTFASRCCPTPAEDKVIHGSKAVGEPPLMLAISVREAIRDAGRCVRQRTWRGRPPLPGNGRGDLPEHPQTSGRSRGRWQERFSVRAAQGG